ncbi:amino acid--tRNA ligase-related protein [Streptomyces sp. NPDC051642]|uniref:amino acid--tRNA ligase-related protein n=1 Tax=Streptomyces sp. NPDC051642 TaxID=3154646 RepID=UPI003443F4B2
MPEVHAGTAALTAGDSADRFRLVQGRAECSFARHSRLVGGPVQDGPDAFAAGRSVAAALRAFTDRVEADRLDGFVVELADPAHGGTTEAVATTTRAVLAGILAADGDAEAAGLAEAGQEHWWFRACGTRWFVLVFAPAYGPESPRHTFGSPSTFVLLQPVAAFDRYARPRGTEIAQTVREDIRTRYAATGRPYDADLAAQNVEALKFVWPQGPTDPPIRWWERPGSPSPTEPALAPASALPRSTSSDPTPNAPLDPTPSTSSDPTPSTTLNPAQSTALDPTPSTSSGPTPSTTLNPAQSTALDPTRSTALGPTPRSPLAPIPSAPSDPTPIPRSPRDPAPSTPSDPIPRSPFDPAQSALLAPTQTATSGSTLNSPLHPTRSTPSDPARSAPLAPPRNAAQDPTPGAAQDAAGYHAESPPAAWDATAALLRAVAVVSVTGTAVDRETARSLFAGLGGLGLDGPHRQVRLYTARSDVALPEGLRPAHPLGAPEEDVFRLALAAACPAAPWPEGPVDGAALTDAVRTLAGRIGCRVPTLAAVAALWLLRSLESADPDRHRWILRRLVWLTDPQVADATRLMSLLTGPGDPLVRLTVPAPAADGCPGTDDEEPLPLADWHRPAAGPGDERRLGGRVLAVRRHRRWTFADLSWSGRSTQLALGAEQSVRPRPGDLLAVRGHGGRSRGGTPVLFVDEVLQHRPTRSARTPGRAAPAVGGVAEAVNAVKPRLAAQGFEEMLSPVLSGGFFGGASRPFTTRHAARNRPLYLRVTTELDLLRRLAEGRTRVYEVGPSFRNESLRGDAVKEFAMLEAYAADLRLDGMADLVARLVTDVLDETRAPRRTAFDDAFAETSGVHPADEAGVLRLAAEHTPDTLSRTADPGVLVQRLWRGTFRHRLPGVALIDRIPGPGSPFIAGEDRAARRVWLSVDGVELAEISVNERDPDRLARRLAEQFRTDPHPVHRDYRDVLETFADGVPPCVGVGLGLERLAGLRDARRRPDAPEEEPRR